MKNILLDTCVFIHLIKKTSTGEKLLEAIHDFDEMPNLIISVVTKAELRSIMIQNKWGENKIKSLNRIINNEVVCIDITNAAEALLDAYSKIDAYSKRKMPDKTQNLLNTSARKMGKNDLWIAATAVALDIPLLTTDSDFDHLQDMFLSVIKISS